MRKFIFSIVIYFFPPTNLLQVDYMKLEEPLDYLYLSVKHGTSVTDNAALEFFI